MAKILTITAKCSDQCASSMSINGVTIGEKEGYVPRVNRKIGGDYIELDIDLETGQIVNWQKPDQATLGELEEMFSGQAEPE